MMRHYCTYFDRKYLTRGLALIESLRRTETSDWEIFVVCMDEMTRIVLRALALPNVQLLPVHEIEARDKELLAVKPTRTVVEYYWTMTPTVILRILERNRAVNQLTYLDADLFFFSSPQPIFDELGSRSILIHEHRFSPAQAQLGSGNGKYNVGLLSFNRTATAFEALSWWRERCLEWCFARTENGKMGDQMYLNDWPGRFSNVAVLEHCGGGLGPWNHDQYRFRKDGNGLPWVNDVPVIFYHFHSFTQVTADVALPVKHPHYPLPWSTVILFFVPYLRALEQAARQLTTAFPQGTWHLSPEQPITSQHTFLIRELKSETLDTLRLSHERVGLDDDWDCMCSNHVIGRPGSCDPSPLGASIKPAVTSTRRNGARTSSAGPATAGVKSGLTALALPNDPGQFYTNVGMLTQACAVLSVALVQSGSNSAGMTQALTNWVKTHSADPLLGPLIDQLQQRDPRLIAFLPQRLQLALGYVTRPIQDLLGWLGTSNETTNLTYDLTPANSRHLAWTLSLVTSTPLVTVQQFLTELDQDGILKSHIRQRTAESSPRLTADGEARYGRRLGWYALVRALKPKVVVETGVDKGLGTCVLAAALLKNRAEGHEGHLYATDIDPSAGFLFADPYAQVGKIMYGDSIATLQAMTEPIDLFIADSAHTAEYERGEYDIVRNRLSPHAVVISDNAHVTQELAHFAECTGRQFLYFQECPHAHFYPGAGMGIAFHVSTNPRLAPMEQVGVVSQHGSSRQQTDEREPVGHGTSMPLVSVIVSTYESEAFMQECLEDLVRQTIADQIEIIVVDAASPQNEGWIVKDFQERHHNIDYIRTPSRIGVYAAWNMALMRAKGTYVTPFSTNDRLRVDAYELLSKHLDDHPDISLVYGDTYLTDLPHQTFERHRRIGVWQWPDYSYDYLLKHCTIGPHPMWRRTLHDTVGYFDESYRALGDQDFWIRVGARHQMLHVPVVTGLYWHSPDGLSNRVEIAGPEEHRLRQTYLKDCAGSASTPVDASASTYDCSVIIPVWNRCELTRQCLEALAATTGDVSWELIVVDNHSTNNTASFLSTLDGDVQIIRNQESLGFAKACNQGARSARGKYLVFLNNDTIPQLGWLNALVAEAEDDASIGVVGSKLLYSDGTIQHAGVVRDRQRGLPYHIYKSFPGDHPAVNQRREFQIVTAACLLIRRSLFEEAGGFDEGYVNGFEDADLCLKVRERGHRVVYQPRSVVVHLEGQAPGRKAHEDTNAVRFLDRWGTQWWAGDEDLHFHVDGYKLKRGYRNGQPGGDIQLMGDIKDRASWAHVAATQTAALKQDWPAVRRELIFSDDWPRDPYVLSWGAMVAQRLQEPVYRAQFLARYLELVDAPAERLELIRMLLEQKHLPSAEEHLRLLLNASPGHAEGLLMKGILGMQREQYRQAEMAFDSAMHEGADRKKCLMGMGMAAMGRAYTQGAWERFLQVLAEYPDDAEAIHWLLRVGTAQNRWQELGEHLRRYVRRNPGDLASRFAFASVLLRGEQIEEARREYDALREVAPGHDGLDQLGQAITGREAALAFEAASS
jgi:GT2 family glycosyltransferase/predicted O-methyltransferase YrrM/tetratricopeptide (TPR) repeat protein